MKVKYRCPKCGTTGHDEVYRIGEGKYDGLYTCLTCWKEWAEDYKEKRKMEEKLKEIFDLELIREIAEANIHDTKWIEEDYDGETRKILVVETLVHGGHGAYIPGMVLDMFGKAEGYDLEDPYNEKNKTIYATLTFLENEINECLNDLLPSEGYYYVGYHEYDGSYCLFYEEYEEGKK